MHNFEQVVLGFKAVNTLPFFGILTSGTQCTHRRLSNQNFLTNSHVCERVKGEAHPPSVVMTHSKAVS